MWHTASVQRTHSSVGGGQETSAVTSSKVEGKRPSSSRVGDALFGTWEGFRHSDMSPKRMKMFQHMQRRDMLAEAKL